MESLKYSEHIQNLNIILSKLQTCEDVDDAVNLYQSGCEHLQHCKTKIEQAQGICYGSISNELS